MYPGAHVLPSGQSAKAGTTYAGVMRLSQTMVGPKFARAIFGPRGGAKEEQSELREKRADILFGGYILCDSRKFTEASREMQMPLPLLSL